MRRETPVVARPLPAPRPATLRGSSDTPRSHDAASNIEAHRSYRVWRPDPRYHDRDRHLDQGGRRSRNTSGDIGLHADAGKSHHTHCSDSTAAVAYTARAIMPAR